MITYSFRKSEPTAFQRFLGDDTSVFYCADCADTPADREFPLYQDDLIELVGIHEDIDCERCGTLLQAVNSTFALACLIG